MDLTQADVDRYIQEYRESEPLYAVEQQSIETTPDAFKNDDFGPRDAEWIVRWYFRRYLGAYPHRDRRKAEEAFAETDFRTMRTTILDAVDAVEEGHTASAIEYLTELPAVNMEIATAFLQFISPEEYVVVGDREWTVVAALTDLSDPYPEEELDMEAYADHLAAVRSLADRYDRSLWECYMAIWRCWVDRFESE